MAKLGVKGRCCPEATRETGRRRYAPTGAGVTAMQLPKARKIRMRPQTVTYGPDTLGLMSLRDMGGSPKYKENNGYRVERVRCRLSRPIDGFRPCQRVVGASRSKYQLRALRRLCFRWRSLNQKWVSFVLGFNFKSSLNRSLTN